jgi:hypothetical protein
MPRQMIDLLGRKFGNLTVVELFSKSSQGKNGTGQPTIWRCVCDCGSHKEKLASTNNLLAGHCKSCGCLPTLGRMGVKNRRWRGGRTKKPDGYIVVRCYDYPRKPQIIVFT